jgi:5'-nucleotidase / UDP-sugar diphosphatase
MVFPKHLLIFLLVCFPLAASSGQQKITFIHTNDMHSHLLGSPSGIDYTPLETGNDATKGGWARIASLIRKTKAERDNPVFVVDAGDFLMGTLFHTLCRERSLELRLMNDMGYDVTTFGNHEFDLRPTGLARIITSARRLGGMPSIVASNIVFSDKSEKDDTLEGVFKSGLVKPYVVITRNGLRIGFFGILGKKAAEVSPYAGPVTFRDQAAAAREMVDLLRTREKVDLVVCLSHGGVDLKNQERSEDVILAGKAPGIDIIISGHTHTPLRRPIVKGNTIIVQAWCFGRWVGILDVELNKGVVRMSGYQAVEINDSIPGDPGISERIDGFKREINAKFLAPFGLTFDEVVAHTEFDLVKQLEDSNLGNLIADANRWYVNKLVFDPRDPDSRVAVGVESNGLIRDGIMRGKTGRISVSDLFNVLPLGIGQDDTIGYPMVSVYLYASEIKNMIEVLTSIYPLKGSSFFLHVSGLRVTYNPRRMILDRVTGISIGDDAGGYAPLDYSSSNKKLYRVAANSYNARFLRIVGDFTLGAINIIPKDRYGTPLKDVSAMLVDADPGKPGTQEAKQWIGLVEYVRSFGVSGRALFPSIPEKYKERQARIVAEPSWNPVNLLKAGNYLTIIGAGAIAIIAGLVVLIIIFITRRVRKTP